MMQIHKITEKESHRQMLPISKSHMYCCHTNVAVRTANPAKCAVCCQTEWWNRKKELKYKPRKNSIKLHCEICKKDYYVSPNVLAIKQNMDGKIIFAETNEDSKDSKDSKDPQLPKAISK
jgi:hypothetical protein